MIQTQTNTKPVEDLADALDFETEELAHQPWHCHFVDDTALDTGGSLLVMNHDFSAPESTFLDDVNYLGNDTGLLGPFYNTSHVQCCPPRFSGVIKPCKRSFQESEAGNSWLDTTGKVWYTESSASDLRQWFCNVADCQTPTCDDPECQLPSSCVDCNDPVSFPCGSPECQLPVGCQELNRLLSSSCATTACPLPISCEEADCQLLFPCEDRLCRPQSPHKESHCQRPSVCPDPSYKEDVCEECPPCSPDCIDQYLSECNRRLECEMCETSASGPSMCYQPLCESIMSSLTHDGQATEDSCLGASQMWDDPFLDLHDYPDIIAGNLQQRVAAISSNAELNNHCYTPSVHPANYAHAAQAKHPCCGPDAAMQQAWTLEESLIPTTVFGRTASTDYHVCQVIDQTTQNTPCNLTFTTPSDLHQHIKTAHKSSLTDSTPPIQCPWSTCLRRFHSANAVLRHLASHHCHHHPFICTIHDCRKSFPSKQQLQMHQNVHKGERHHRCSTCQKCFADASALSKHMRIHKPRETKLRCPYCGRGSYTRSDQVKRHVLRTCKVVRANGIEREQMPDDWADKCAKLVQVQV